MNARLALAACLLLHATCASAQDTLRCGDVLTESAQLDEDLFCEDVALTIAASDVMLALNGHTISGPGASASPDPAAIVVDGMDAVKILGPGSIDHYGTAIRISGGSGHLVKDVTVVRQFESAETPYPTIVLSNTSASRVEDCTAQRLAIIAEPSQEAQGNVVKGSVLDWIEVLGCGAQHNLITDNDLSEHGDLGYAVTLRDGPHRNYILDNRVAGDITAHRASLNIIAGNRSTSPEGMVLLLGHPEYNTTCPDGVPVATRENVVVANDLRTQSYALMFGTADSNYAVHNTLMSTHWYTMGFDYFANDNDARFNTVLPGPYGTANDAGSGNRW